MNTESSNWIVWGVLLFVVIGVIAFFVRNSAAKTDKDQEPENSAKQDGSVSIAKTRKQ